MKLGIGIDTGGTYTDAVVFDFESKRVLSSAKALTTKDDLSVGIGGALDALDSRYLSDAEVISLSTTLATNACVEGKGGRAKLLFIGVDDSTLKRVGTDYGIKSGDFFCAPARGSFGGKVLEEPDWDALIRDTQDWLSDAEGLGIVELYAMKNGALCERKAKNLISEHYGFPVILGSELFNGLNSVQRGAGTLLNAKLVPIIREFLAAIKKALAERSIKAPVVIVRSDGSLMSEEFSSMRPVETILCGPASSVLGGMNLTGSEDCVIVDMGGTTTDISLVKGNMPVKARDGINIGGWKTFVQGVYIDTFGLGGDSAVRAFDGQLVIGPKRVVPISLLVRDYPQIANELRALLNIRGTHTQPLHEFYCLVKDISKRRDYTETERAFCLALEKKPLILREAAAAAGSDIYRLDVSRLEEEGVVIRAGLTPTDIMHIKGDFNAYDPEGAKLAARYVIRALGMDDEDPAELEGFCDRVYEEVKKTLYCNIVRILLTDRDPRLAKKGIDKQLMELIKLSWEQSGAGGAYFESAFKTRAKLVSIGAPTHIFLPDVAAALGTVCVVPDFAGVANAVGAIVGNIAVTVEVELRPNYTPGGITGYTVYAKDENIVTKLRQDAMEYAIEEAKKRALEEAGKRGITGDIRLDTDVRSQTGTAMRGAVIDLGSIITATAIGGAVL